MGLELRAVQSDVEWAALHAIRRAVLWAPGRQRVEYDANHPDDRRAGNVPLVLTLDEQPIGTCRLDLQRGVAVVRLVAILPEYQRQGHGRMMEDLLAEKGWELGARQFRVNSAADAVGFYEKCGWHVEGWDPDDSGLTNGCVQMVKALD